MINSPELQVGAKLHANIELCQNFLDSFCSAKDSGKASASFDFMRALLNLYLELQLNPSIQTMFEFQNFLKKSSPLIARMSNQIIYFEMNIPNLFDDEAASEYYYDPWPEVCWRRSAFEALKELYQDTKDPELTICLDPSNEDFDPEDIDFIINEKAFSAPIAENEIPAGIPRSHWWWWGEKTEEA
jgi:hypothetical protein